MDRYHIVALPEETTIARINKLRDFVYQNNFRFSNKALGTDTHITCAQILCDTFEPLETLLQNEISNLKIFTIKSSTWQLTNEEKKPNAKLSQNYAWIALKFPRQVAIVSFLDDLLNTMLINDNVTYVNDVQLIEGRNDDTFLGLGDHLNLCNYTRIERAEECWSYFNENLPESITFDRIALRDGKGQERFVLDLT